MPTTLPPLDDNPADLQVLDQLIATLRVMNTVDGENEYKTNNRYCTDREGSPHWHVWQAAQQAAAHLVGGNQRRAYALVLETYDQYEPAADVLGRMRRDWAYNETPTHVVDQLLSRAFDLAEVDTIHRLGIAAGLLWRCTTCNYVTSDEFDECDGCAKPRPVPA
jgi:hypothetical protein